MKLKDKICLVTGASSGIGRATAIKMAKEGATIVTASRNKKGNQETLKAIEHNGGEGFYKIVDVTEEADIKALIDEILDRYGRIDCAFNNAGTLGSFDPIFEQQLSDFNRTFEVNVKGVWLCMKYEAEAMLKSGGGSIANCSSWLSRGALAGSSAYSASKAAVDGMMLPAALEWAGKGIRVNNVAPGGIDTKMTREAFGSPEAVDDFGKTHPVKRIGKPEEVANLVTWLCSDEASFITGERILVDGGYSIPGQRS